MKMDTVSTEPATRSTEPSPRRTESPKRSTEPDTRPSDLETRAAEALAALLGRVSAIKLMEMKREPWPRDPYSGISAPRIPARQIPARPILARPIPAQPIPSHRIPTRTIIAQIEVYGHSHTLACEVYPDGDPDRLRKAFHENRAAAAPLASDATPVLIAPYLSPEAQDLCKQRNAGFLDFEGNARLTVGEVFIGLRSLPGRAAAPQSAALRKVPARSAVNSIFLNELPSLSRKHPGAALPA
jgi:hypothetical protein